MSKKFIIENTIAANHLTLSVTGRIWYNETANALKEVIDNALSQGATSSTLTITTPGGNVFEAVDIIAQLKRLPNLQIICGSVVASAGTRILAEFENVTANSATQFMIHKPSGSIDGNEDDIESELKAIKNITADYRKAYAKKFKKTEDEVEALWQKNYWMTADEALQMGLINAVVVEEVPYDASVVEMMVACGCPTIPKPTTENPKPTQNNLKMDKNQIIAALGMSADATDEQIAAKIKENKQKADSATAVETQADADKKAAATKFATQAVFDKKIKATDISAYEALHLQNATEAEKLVKELPALQAGSSFVKDQASGVDATDKSAWTLDDYLDKDPQAFEELIKTDPAKVKQLNAAYAAKK